MAAPRLAMAGKQAPQPMADTMLPSAPVLSAARVMSAMTMLPVPMQWLSA